jgi:hypothetical protein
MFTQHSLHPASLLVSVIPYFHGQGRGIYQMPYWGAYWHHLEAQIYLGALAISLAACFSGQSVTLNEVTGSFGNNRFAEVVSVHASTGSARTGFLFPTSICPLALSLSKGGSMALTCEKLHNARSLCQRA